MQNGKKVLKELNIGNFKHDNVYPKKIYIDYVIINGKNYKDINIFINFKLLIAKGSYVECDTNWRNPVTITVHSYAQAANFIDIYLDRNL